MAWAFLGPDSEVKSACQTFKVSIHCESRLVLHISRSIHDLFRSAYFVSRSAHYLSRSACSISRSAHVISLGFIKLNK